MTEYAAFSIRPAMITALIIGTLLAHTARAQQTARDKDPFPKHSYGLKIAGGGAIGPTMRFDATDRLSIGLNAILRPYIILEENTSHIEDSGVGLMIPVEIIFWTSHHYEGAQGPTRHGAGLIGGYCISKYSEAMVALSYEYERYVRRNRVFNAAVGLGYLELLDDLPEDTEQLQLPVILYFSFAWRWGPRPALSPDMPSRRMDRTPIR